MQKYYDKTPTQGSTNPVRSDGLNQQLAQIGSKIDDVNLKSKVFYGAYLDTRNNNILTITISGEEVTVIFPSGYYMTRTGYIALQSKTLTCSEGTYKTAYYDHTLNDLFLTRGIVSGNDKTVLFEVNTGWGNAQGGKPVFREDFRIIGIKSPFSLNGQLYYPQSPDAKPALTHFGTVNVFGTRFAVGDTFNIAFGDFYSFSDKVLMEKVCTSKKRFYADGTISAFDSTAYRTIVIPINYINGVYSFTFDAGVEKTINIYDSDYKFIKNYYNFSTSERTLNLQDIISDGGAYLTICYRIDQVSGKYIHINKTPAESDPIYCSSSLGDDENDGLTESTPVKTIARATSLISEGKTLRFKCGDVFYTHTVITADGFNIDSYGYGNLPEITHFMIISGEFTQDTQYGENVWKIDLSSANVGGAGYDSETSDNNNVGFIYDKETDTIVWGHKVNHFTESEISGGTTVHSKSWLHEEGDFLQRGSIIYLYSTENPNNYENLYLGGLGTGIEVNNCSVRNVKIIGCNFGIIACGNRKNFIIENVVLDLIGGCSKYDGQADFFRWGNGFEFWVDRYNSPENIMVTKCRVSRVFDAGSTIQGRYVMSQAETDAGKVVENAERAKNVVFTHNLFYRCRQAYEAFSILRDVNQNVIGNYPMENCIFEENVCIESGNNEFNSPEIRDTNLLTQADGMIIRGNVFLGGGINYRHSKFSTFTFGKNNIFYVLPGEVLFNTQSEVYIYPIENDTSTWINGATTYQEAVDNVISLYRETMGDKFSDIIGITPEELTRMVGLSKLDATMQTAVAVFNGNPTNFKMEMKDIVNGEKKVYCTNSKSRWVNIIPTSANNAPKEATNDYFYYTQYSQYGVTWSNTTAIKPDMGKSLRIKAKITNMLDTTGAFNLWVSDSQNYTERVTHTIFRRQLEGNEVYYLDISLDCAELVADYGYTDQLVLWWQIGKVTDISECRLKFEEVFVYQLAGDENFTNFSGDDVPEILHSLDWKISSEIDNIESCFSSIALFESIAVIGDSYSSGCVVGITGGSTGDHYPISWLQIMARKNGVVGTNYSYGGATPENWLARTTDNRGLQGLLADTPKKLYFIKLGINGTYSSLGSISDCHEDYSLNADSFYGNYGRIIGNIKAHAPKSRIICITNSIMSYSDRNTAIKEIASYYGVMVLDEKEDSFFTSDFYKNNLSGSHPIGVTYAGMAMAYERLLVKCIIDHVDYFLNFVGD